MSITVVTSEHGRLTYEANNWDADEKGRLWVGTDEDGVAEFNVGEWSFVFEKKDEAEVKVVEAEIVPRVFTFLNKQELPEGVFKVTDRRGDVWSSYSYQTVWLRDKDGQTAKGYPYCGPFTEVIS